MKLARGHGGYARARTRAIVLVFGRCAMAILKRIQGAFLFAKSILATKLDHANGVFRIMTPRSLLLRGGCIVCVRLPFLFFVCGPASFPVPVLILGPVWWLSTVVCLDFSYLFPGRGGALWVRFLPRVACLVPFSFLSLSLFPFLLLFAFLCSFSCCLWFLVLFLLVCLCRFLFLGWIIEITATATAAATATGPVTGRARGEVGGVVHDGRSIRGARHLVQGWKRRRYHPILASFVIIMFFIIAIIALMALVRIITEFSPFPFPALGPRRRRKRRARTSPSSTITRRQCFCGPAHSLVVAVLCGALAMVPRRCIMWQ